jgi:glutamyl-tRNA synthetase
MLNFLALLGWSLDEKTELFTREDLIKNFSLERISRTAAVFNREKLDWMNGVYIRGLDTRDFARRVIPFLERDLPPEVDRPLDEEYVMQIVPLVKERAKTLAEVTELTVFFWEKKLEYAPENLLIKGADYSLTCQAYRETREIIEKTPFHAADLEKEFRSLAEKLQLKAGQLFSSLRMAVTGRTVSPPLFETMEALGEQRVKERIQDALDKLSRIQPQ